jgi:outer membrane putative beta-barrel porin/alpha-amylase
MNGICMRNLVFGAVAMIPWVAMAHAQEPLPPGPPQLPRIVTPDDPPPATNPAPASNPQSVTNPQSGSTPDSATNAIQPANPLSATNPQPAPDVAPPVVDATSSAQLIESPIANIVEPRRRRRSEAEGEIETDRDSFTPSVRTVGKGWLVTEAAYSFIDNRNARETNSLPELLFRYGITERIELRLGFNYEAGGTGSSVSGGGSGGGEFLEPGALEHETNISYGLKVALTRQDEWLPESIVIVQGFTPTSGRDTATQYIVTYAWGWELPNCWKLDAAVRYSEDSEDGDRFNIWAPSIVLKVPFAERWAGHIEYFSEMSANKREDFSKQFISPGLHCLLTPNLEVGVRVGWGMNTQSPLFFSNVGVGWRF